MESVASSSSPPDHRQHHHDGCSRHNLTQPVVDRILRALDHPLRLLHRSSGSEFFVLGATGNVYTVSLSSTPSCTCPDRTAPCKHILFILIRVLGLPLDDSCIRRRILRPCQLSRLLSLPTSPEALAGASLRQRFHQFISQARQGTRQAPIEIKDGTICPVCLEEMRLEERLLACHTCRNPIHEECLKAWKRSSRRRSATCVICRARWRNRADQDAYLNLSAYVSDDEMAEANVMCVD